MPKLLRALCRSSSCLLLALLLVATLLCLVPACTSSAQAIAKCELDAVKALPLDEPDTISVADVRHLGTRIKACQPPPAASSPAAPDAGGG